MPLTLRLRCRLIRACGQHEVVFGDVAVVAPHVVGEFRFGAAEIVRRAGPAGEGHIHEVGRATHHAAGGARPGQHHLPPPLQVVVGAGDDEGQTQSVAAVGVGEGHRVAVRGVALQVVQRSDGAGAAGQAGMGGHVGDALAAQPDLGLSLAQTGQILRARACRHGSLPPCCDELGCEARSPRVNAAQENCLKAHKLTGVKRVVSIFDTIVWLVGFLEVRKAKQELLRVQCHLSLLSIITLVAIISCSSGRHRRHYTTLNPSQIHSTRGGPPSRGAQGQSLKGGELNA